MSDKMIKSVKKMNDFYILNDAVKVKFVDVIKAVKDTNFDSTVSVNVDISYDDDMVNEDEANAIVSEFIYSAIQNKD